MDDLFTPEINSYTPERANQSAAFIETIYAGNLFVLGFANPATDSRVPDLIVQPELGVIYSNSTSKDAEHASYWT